MHFRENYYNVISTYDRQPRDREHTNNIIQNRLHESQLGSEEILLFIRILFHKIKCSQFSSTPSSVLSQSK